MIAIDYNCAAMTPASARAVADIVSHEAEAKANAKENPMSAKDALDYVRAEFTKRVGSEPIMCASKICEVKAQRYFKRKRRAMPLPRPLATVDCLKTFHFFIRG